MFTENQKNQFIQEVDVLLNTVKDRLLPAISEDALIYDEELNMGCPDEVINNFVAILEMDKSILNMSASWLYHLFEKSYDSVSAFPTSRQSWNDRRTSLNNIGVSTGAGSRFHDIQIELRELNNALKHGSQSPSAERLHNINNSLCRKRIIERFGEDNKIVYEIQEITVQQLEDYAYKMKEFWEEFFIASQSNRTVQI